MQCIESPTPKNQQDLKSIFRSARKRPTRLPRSVTFKTDIGLSAKLVNELGGRRKAYKWVDEVIKLAREQFHLKSLHTKVRIRVMEKKVYRITNPNIDDLIKQYRKNARYPLGFFDADNTENDYKGIAKLSTACDPTNSGYIIAKVYTAKSYAACTLAHEIGHIIGMSHNKAYRGCYGGVMNPLGLKEGWTKCNNDDFKSYYFSRGYTCLF